MNIDKEMKDNLKEKDKERIARENLLRESEEIKGETVKGYDFNKGVNYEEIVKSFKITGYQAT